MMGNRLLFPNIAPIGVTVLVTSVMIPTLASADPTLERGQSIAFVVTRPVTLVGDGKAVPGDSVEAMVQNGEVVSAAALRMMKPFPPNPTVPYCFLQYPSDAAPAKDTARIISPGVDVLPYEVNSSLPGEIVLRLPYSRRDGNDGTPVVEARCYDAGAKAEGRKLTLADIRGVLSGSGSVQAAAVQAIAMIRVGAQAVGQGLQADPKAPCPGPASPPPPAPAPAASDRLSKKEQAEARKKIEALLKNEDVLTVTDKVHDLMDKWRALQERSLTELSDQEKEKVSKGIMKLQEELTLVSTDMINYIEDAVEPFGSAHRKEVSRLFEQMYRDLRGRKAMEPVSGR